MEELTTGAAEEDELPDIAVVEVLPGVEREIELLAGPEEVPPVAAVDEVLTEAGRLEVPTLDELI